MARREWAVGAVGSEGPEQDVIEAVVLAGALDRLEVEGLLDDALLPWPVAAARFRNDWLPLADWVVLDDVGHAPQMDVPLETAQLILDFSS